VKNLKIIYLDFYLLNKPLNNYKLKILLYFRKFPNFSETFLWDVASPRLRSVWFVLNFWTVKTDVVEPLQTTPTQNQPDTPLQSELLPELTGPAQSPPAEHIAAPPSTVDTAALSEEPLPGEELEHVKAWGCTVESWRTASVRRGGTIQMILFPLGVFPHFKVFSGGKIVQIIDAKCKK